MVKDATRDRHALVHTKDEWLPPLHLELEPSLEHEKELVFVLVAVPVDELALDHRKSDDGVIHARERLIHPRLIPRALCGDVDLRELTVLVVLSDVVVLHTRLPLALDWLGETNRRGISSWVSVFGEACEHVACFRERTPLLSRSRLGLRRRRRRRLGDRSRWRSARSRRRRLRTPAPLRG